jgi:DNA-binding response OmpR family regulator
MTTRVQEKILLVDDDAAIRSAVGRLLLSAGYQPLEAADGAIALELMRREQPAVIILDIEMPGLGGLDALDQLRQGGSELSVIILSGLSDVEHRLRGLDLGADDYITKPFDPRELLARIAALLRRERKFTQAPPRKWQRGDVLVDLDAKHAARAGRRLPLTTTEFAILETLAASEGEPVSRKTLLNVVWGYSQAANTRTLETHIWRLRKKLGDKAGEPGWIVNRQGLGYMLSVPLD